MEYQEQRAKRIDVFEDTMRWCEADRRLVEAIKQTRADTVLYKTPMMYCKQIQKRFDEPCRVSVTRGRTMSEAGRLCLEYPKERIGVLNFASATNPGGSVIRGSSAQEESLCRCSTLYPCLNTTKLFREYYQYHRKRKDFLYTDACIYIPGIISIKKDGEFPERMVEEEWFVVDVISCAAPNLRGQSQNITNLLDEEKVFVTEAELRELLNQRIAGILQIAAENRIDVLVLGAFGCGAFCNSPFMVAETFKTALKKYLYSFRAVTFAVYCPPENAMNYEIFSASLKELL